MTIPGLTKVGVGTLRTVMSGMPGLLSIDLGKAAGMDDEVLGVIAENCKKLQCLDITDCEQVGDEGMLLLAKNSKSLRRVSVLNLSELSVKGPNDQ